MSKRHRQWGNRELSCVNCDEVLKAREDKFVLKYFLVGTQKRLKRVPGRRDLAGESGQVRQMSPCRRLRCHSGSSQQEETFDV